MSNINETYRGKVKTVETLDDEKVRIIFHDDITAGDGEKKDNIVGKGALNLKISTILLNLVEKAGVPHHQLKLESNTTIIARKLKIQPIEVVIRNVIAGSFARRYGFEEGTDLEIPLVEFFVKDDELHDPLIDADVIVKRRIVSQELLDLMKARAIQVNKALVPYFKAAGMILVDFKLEFGLDKDGHLYLGDEISADSMRVWDINTREKLDKDRFRRDLGDVLAGYQAIIDRLEGIKDYNQKPVPITAEITIRPKNGVTNPSGDVTKRTLVNAGIKGITSVQMGKIVTITFNDTTDRDWINQLHSVSQNIITNPLIEQYIINFK
jgi:phosphoribosylaminoimidazole-succinocarboxamide synthase